jgi:hypothetical protein
VHSEMSGECVASLELSVGLGVGGDGSGPDGSACAGGAGVGAGSGLGDDVGLREAGGAEGRPSPHTHTPPVASSPSAGLPGGETGIEHGKSSPRLGPSIGIAPSLPLQDPDIADAQTLRSLRHKLRRVRAGCHHTSPLG